jgi:hypothetical protein
VVSEDPVIEEKSSSQPSPSNIVGQLDDFVGSISKSPTKAPAETSLESYEHNTHSQNTAHEIANGCTNRCASCARKDQQMLNA